LGHLNERANLALNLARDGALVEQLAIALAVSVTYACTAQIHRELGGGTVPPYVSGKSNQQAG